MTVLSRSSSKMIRRFFGSFAWMTGLGVVRSSHGSARPAQEPSHAGRNTPNGCNTRSSMMGRWRVGLDRTTGSFFYWQTSILRSIRSLFFFCIQVRSRQLQLEQDRLVDSRPADARQRLGARSISRNVGAVRGGSHAAPVDRARAQHTCKT